MKLLTLKLLEERQYKQVAEWEYGKQPKNTDWPRYFAEMNAPKWVHYGVYSGASFVGALSFEWKDPETIAYHLVTARWRVNPFALAEKLLSCAEFHINRGFKIIADIPIKKRAAVWLARRCGMREVSRDKTARHFVFTREDLNGKFKT